MAQGGVERNQELADGRIYADARSFDQRIGDVLQKHGNMRNLLVGSVVAAAVLPVTIPLVFPVVFLTYGWWSWRINRFRMPVRYPEWIKRIDPSERDDNAGVRNGRGIEYMGVERRGRTIADTLEIWASDSDVRTHRVIMGTTGAGKTQSLLSILFNPLCWGSGFSMTDGKAQIDVTANIFVMAWLFWREDDVLVLNYMRGGQDRFKDMVTRPPVGQRKTRVSNTWNPFASANHETINQIIDSIMEKATGDGAQWQAKAINMKNALVQTIAYLRARGVMLMSVSTIREQMALDNMIKLAMRPDLPSQAAAAIRSYLSSGLPGFSWAKAKAGKPQDQETLIQHGYLTGQFTRTLGLMTDTYSDIFDDEIPEFDTSDVILNNRMGMTMIPTLEKGVEEAGNLGKMQVASAKMMMAENLGYELEGVYEDVVENRPTNTHRPYYMVMDELGYYFAPGIDLMFAQGRSLNIALIAAGQDFQAMSKNYKNEVESMIANTRFKVAMKLEDPKETFEIFQKAAGQGAVARLQGFEAQEPSELGIGGDGYRKTSMTSIENTDRISLQELKNLGPGDGVMVVGGKVVRFRGFNLFLKFKFDKKKVNIRINTFLPIAAPDEFSAISGKCKPVNGGKNAIASRLLALLRNTGGLNWGNMDDLNSDPVVAAILGASAAMSDRPSIPPQHRGIVLFMAAINAMEKESAAEATDDIEEEEDESGRGGGAERVSPGKKPPREAVSATFDDDIDSPVLTKQNHDSFLNDPPIVQGSRFVDGPQNNLASPDWGDDASDAAVVEKGPEDMVFGEPVEKGPVNVKFTDKTRDTVRNIIEGLAGGSEAITTAEVERETASTERLVDASCEFKDAGKGTMTPPVVNSDPQAVESLLDDLMSTLSGSRSNG